MSNHPARILAETAESEPTKPSKPSSVGFEGATSDVSPKIEGLSKAGMVEDPWHPYERTQANQGAAKAISRGYGVKIPVRLDARDRLALARWRPQCESGGGCGPRNSL
jgi:hypothetical protein